MGEEATLERDSMDKDDAFILLSRTPFSYGQRMFLYLSQNH